MNIHFNAKLRIGQPGDKYEQEADRAADAAYSPGVFRDKVNDGTLSLARQWVREARERKRGIFDEKGGMKELGPEVYGLIAFLAGFSEAYFIGSNTVF